MPTYVVIQQNGPPIAGLVFLGQSPELGHTFEHAERCWIVQRVEHAKDPGYTAGTIHCHTIDCT